MRNLVQVHLETAALVDDAAQVREIDGTEAFNKPFEFTIVLVTRDTIGLDDRALLTNPATLVFARGTDEVRRIHGAIVEINDSLDSEGAHLIYRIRFMPRVWRMRLRRRSQVFIDQSVPEIVRTKLEQAGFTAPEDLEFRLLSNYPSRDLVIQYEESDLQFFTRLAEHVGIAYFFEHRNGRDVIVFTDDNSGFTPAFGASTFPFIRRGEETGVFAIEGTTRIVPSRYVVKDYNYRTPGVSLLGSATIEDGDGGEVIEYGAHFRTPDEAAQIAKVRAEQLFATRRTFQGKSDIPHLRPGVSFTLDGHSRVEPKLAVTYVRHRALLPTFNSGTDEERSYFNEFHAIPAVVTFRPPRETPKPKVHGAISGVIEAAAPGPYAELDDDGRYHVRFMLDTGDAPRGKASSLLRMAQPHAGAGYGFHFPLRDGVEVVLTCIEGDPDRPIITGAVPNPTLPSTVASKNGMRNVIRTGGGTEMNIDDTDGSSRFKLTVPRSNTVLQLGAPNEPTDGVYLGTDQQLLMEMGTTIELIAASDITTTSIGGSIDINACEHVNATGKTIAIEATAGNVGVKANDSIDIHATNKISESSQAITMEATGGDVGITASSAIDAKGKSIVMKADAALSASALLMNLHGTAVVNVSSGGLLDLQGSVLLAANAPSVNVTGGAVNISSPKSIVLTVGGSSISIAPGSITIKAPVVSIEGAPIKLNC